jgi:hypothetical protein
LFIVVLLVVIWRVSRPQTAPLWSVYEMPGDFIRLALGLIVGVWMVIQLFKLPDDADGYRTWVYLGCVAVPFALILAVASW